MEEKLKMIFSNVNDWLKFAEAKNATLTAFDGAAIFFLLGIIGDERNKLAFFNPVLTVLLIIISISLFISLFSFIPSFIFLESKKINNSKNDNLLYFGDIYKYSPEEYLKEIYRKYESVNRDINDYQGLEKDLAIQIVNNSKIAMQKCKFFNVSIKIVLIGILITPIGFIIVAK